MCLWSQYGQSLKKLKIELPYDPAIPLLDIYPAKFIIQRDTCTPVFIAALFTIARTWKKPKCPSTEKWVKIWYTHTHTHTHIIEYCSAIRWRRKWQPTLVFLPGESQGRGSLVGCRLWGCTESDTTEAT